jgi:putative copper export protein
MRVFITGPSGADICILPGKKKCTGEISARAILLVSVVTLLAHALHLILHASVITETPLTEIFPVMPTFLLHTRYGRLALLRTIFLVAAVILSYRSTRRNDPLIARMGVVLSFMILASISMSGHQGTKGLITIRFFLDVFHIGAVSLWIGGLLFIRFCYAFLLSNAGAEIDSAFNSLISRFSRLATFCVLIGAAAGVWIGFIKVESLTGLVHSRYGFVLLTKSLVAGILIFLGGINKFVLLPRINISSELTGAETSVSRIWLYRIISAEVVAGLAILFLTSLLTHLSPED